MRLANLIFVVKKQFLCFIIFMKFLNWSPEKNEIIKRERGLAFEEIAYLIRSENILDIKKNPAYSNQKLYILELDGCAVVVPAVKTENEIFLKTAFPSRKYTKLYGLEGKL